MFFENHLCKSKKLTVIHAHCFCHGVYINRAGWIPPLGIAKLTGISTGNHTGHASTGPYKAHSRGTERKCRLLDIYFKKKAVLEQAHGYPLEV